MEPLIDANEIVSILVDSTTGYLVTFAPIFLLVGGILLAYFVSLLILSYFWPEKFASRDDEVV